MPISHRGESRVAFPGRYQRCSTTDTLRIYQRSRGVQAAYQPEYTSSPLVLRQYLCHHAIGSSVIVRGLPTPHEWYIGTVLLSHFRYLHIVCGDHNLSKASRRPSRPNGVGYYGLAGK